MYIDGAAAIDAKNGVLAVCFTAASAGVEFWVDVDRAHRDILEVLFGVVIIEDRFD